MNDATARKGVNLYIHLWVSIPLQFYEAETLNQMIKENDRFETY